MILHFVIDDEAGLTTSNYNKIMSLTQWHTADRPRPLVKQIVGSWFTQEKKSADLSQTCTQRRSIILWTTGERLKLLGSTIIRMTNTGTDLSIDYADQIERKRSFLLEIFSFAQVTLCSFYTFYIEKKNKTKKKPLILSIHSLDAN